MSASSIASRMFGVYFLDFGFRFSLKNCFDDFMRLFNSKKHYSERDELPTEKLYAAVIYRPDVTKPVAVRQLVRKDYESLLEFCHHHTNDTDIKESLEAILVDLIEQSIPDLEQIPQISIGDFPLPVIVSFQDMAIVEVLTEDTLIILHKLVNANYHLRKTLKHFEDVQERLFFVQFQHRDTIKTFKVTEGAYREMARTIRLRRDGTLDELRALRRIETML